MKVYRGTRDFLPHLLDHRRISPAVFGEATYFALDEQGARFYSQGGYSLCQVVTHYQISLNNVLEISSHQWENIGSFNDSKKPLKINKDLQEKLDYQNDHLSPIMLSKVLYQSGFDGAILTGNIEGGPQVVIPPNNIPIEVLGFDIILAKTMLGKTKNNYHIQDFVSLLKSYDIIVQETDCYLNFFIDYNKFQKLKSIFEFVEQISQNYFYSIDFKSLKCEFYDEN